MLTRRQFLATSLAVGATAVLAGCTPAAPQTASPSQLTFGNRLAIPPLLEPTTSASGDPVYELTAQEGESMLLPGKSTPSRGFNGSYLGPTIRAKRGDVVRMKVSNQLKDETTVHWHGMILPGEMDGGPHQMIPAGGIWEPTWTVDQSAATLWYHPHVHGTTALQVYSGLSGLFLIDDDEAANGLPSVYGVDDVPLIIQDKAFDDAGAMITGDGKIGGGSDFGILGNTILVNGTFDPYFEATTTMVRFRVLNGSNTRFYHLEWSDGREFQVVGNDAGLLNSEVPVKRVSISPGERLEIVVSFTAGEEVLLRSATGENGVIDDGEFDILKVRAAAQLSASPAHAEVLAALAPIAPTAGARERFFSLGETTINGKEMDMNRIDSVVGAGAVEIWSVANDSYAHNFHIHGAVFTILDRDGEAPDPVEAGHKDTVFIPECTSVRLAVAFADYPDPSAPYMYHCHLLRHEDMGLMAQFVLVESGQEEVQKQALGVSEDDQNSRSEEWDNDENTDDWNGDESSDESDDDENSNESDQSDQSGGMAH